MFRTLLLLLVLVSPLALASGRAGFRATYPFSFRAYVEQTVWTVSTPAFTVEAATGLEVAASPWTVTPYTGVYVTRERLWLGVLFGRTFGAPSGFGIMVLGGWSW